MVDSKHQEIIFLVQETDFLESGIILEVPGKLSKGLKIILRGQHLETLGIRRI
jgi:hypothetical protein